MTRASFAMAISEIEKRFSRPFVPDRDLRKRLLEKAFTEIEGCSDSALLRAADGLMMSGSFIPSPDGLVAAVKKEHLKDAKADDDAQEKRAGSYERYGGNREALTDNMRKVMKVFTTGNPTRQEWNLLVQAMYAEMGTSDMLGPTAYAAMCERLDLDMDAPAFTGGLGSIMREEAA